MATIKSYTDLSQSKTLSKILPLESADMRYTPFGDTHPWFLSNDLIEKDSTPCWSLAALLGVLPNNETIRTNISRGSWKIDTAEYLPNTWWCEYEDTKTETEFNISADNPVDACVNMIIKLHELNLL